ncbi:MAG: tRNA (adenosine(37)-N6)-threonylcarbamoyltransferase complex dimerization subunit type 1 TsaB [Alphaproteobacteria bacterium]
MVPTMHLLAMDCAGPACSVALFRGDEVVAARHEGMQRGQAERLVPMIDEVLKDAATPPADLDILAVTVGPGAFTGIRIGLASARAMALALDIPATGITTFDATIRNFLSGRPAPPAHPIAVVLETKRRDYYARIFGPDGAALSDGAALDGPALCGVLSDIAAEGCILIGDGARRFLENDGAGIAAADLVCGDGYTAVDVGRCTLGLPPDRSLPPRPLYLRPPDVTVRPAT